MQLDLWAHDQEEEKRQLVVTIGRSRRYMIDTLIALKVNGKIWRKIGEGEAKGDAVNQTPREKAQTSGRQFRCQGTSEHKSRRKGSFKN